MNSIWFHVAPLVDQVKSSSCFFGSHSVDSQRYRHSQLQQLESAEKKKTAEMSFRLHNTFIRLTAVWVHGLALIMWVNHRWPLGPMSETWSCFPVPLTHVSSGPRVGPWGILLCSCNESVSRSTSASWKTVEHRQAEVSARITWRSVLDIMRSLWSGWSESLRVVENLSYFFRLLVKCTLHGTHSSNI